MRLGRRVGEPQNPLSLIAPGRPARLPCSGATTLSSIGNGGHVGSRRERERVQVEASRRLRAELGAAVSQAGTAAAVADRLCRACVDLLQVDGA